jgi:hypothetical protein
VNTFLPPVLDANERPASHPGRFTPGKVPRFPLGTKPAGLQSLSDGFCEELETVYYNSV